MLLFLKVFIINSCKYLKSLIFSLMCRNFQYSTFNFGAKKLENNNKAQVGHTGPGYFTFSDLRFKNCWLGIIDSDCPCNKGCCGCTYCISLEYCIRKSYRIPNLKSHQLESENVIACYALFITVEFRDEIVGRWSIQASNNVRDD